MPGVSIWPAGALAMTSAVAARKASSSGPSMARIRPGLVQNWPAPWVRAADELRRDGRAARLEGGGQEQDRIDAAHLGVERDRLGPALGDGREGQAGAARTGEAGGLDAVVGDQALRDLDAGVVQHGEDARRQAAGLDRRLDGAADQLDVPGWAGWALTTTGQPAARAEAVSPPATEKASGSARRAEHGHRAQRHVAQAQVDAGQGLRSGWAGSMRASSQPPRSTPGEHPQLAHGAAAFAFQAGAGQAGLGHGADDQRRRRSPRSWRRRFPGARRAARPRWRDRGRRPPPPGRHASSRSALVAPPKVTSSAPPVLGSIARIGPPVPGRRRRSEVHR